MGCSIPGLVRSSDPMTCLMSALSRDKRIDSVYMALALKGLRRYPSACTTMIYIGLLHRRESYLLSIDDVF